MDSSIDLTGYFPYGPEEGFEEAGYTFKAWQPANGTVDRVFVLRAFKGDELVGERTVPMFHPNVWGVDVDDHRSLEIETDALIKELTG